MITTSNLLFELARSIKNGTPEVSDSDLQVQDNISPVMLLVSPHDSMSIPSTSNANEGSFHTVAALNVIAASGALNNLIATLSKGLWRFNFHMAFTSNYLTSASQFEHYINLQYTGGLGSMPMIGVLPGGSAANPQAQVVTRTVDILIPVEGAQLRSVAQNNAAGQSALSVTDVFCQRLL